MQNERLSQVKADLSLLFVTLIWGTTFILVKNAIMEIPPMFFLAIRFTIAALVLAIIPKTFPKTLGALKIAWPAGLMLGLAYGLQTVGLQVTSAS
ncbi:MAG: EamA family transporter, partial [bacterium]|nr:EamA family transporter [bacterium]